MRKKPAPDAWWIRSPLIVATYVIAADILPIVLLVIVNGLGYLPYSDRPGPGWQTAHLPIGPELHFFASFALLILRGTALYGFIFALSGLVLGFCSPPRWALRVLAVPTAFLASGLMMAAGGWYIAISAVGVWAAAGCGALWGFIVFPRLVPQMSRPFPTPVRIALPIMMFVCSIYFLAKPLLPNPALTNAKIEVIRRDDSGTDLSKIDLSFVGPSIPRQAEGPGKYASVNRMEFTTDGTNQVRALLIIDDDLPVAHTFVLPRSGNAVYRQRHGKWNEELVEARSSGISMKLTSDDGRGIVLDIIGHCCSSMSQSFGPYR